MLSKNTISIFCNLLKNLAEKEKQVEINRQVLCQNLNFDAYQVFSYLDLESKNYLIEINLITFLQKKNQIPCNLEELQFLILIYDENFDAKLSYSEFLNFVLSDNDFELRKKTRERICSRYDNNTIDFNVEYSLVKLFQKELDLIRTTRRLIEELKACEDFNVHDLFHYLKGYGDISMESLKLFLEKNLINLDDNDIRNIFKIMDLNKDSKIDFAEFHHILCFPNLKCNCCSFCQCNCQVSNKMLYNHFDEMNNGYENINVSQNLSFKYNNFSKESNKPKSSNFHKDSINNTSNNKKLIQINELANENNYKKTYSLNNPSRRIKYCENCPCYSIYVDSTIAENKFLQYITKLIELESKIESAKINLIQRQDFNIDDAFLIFSNPESKVITFTDFQNGLKELSLYPSIKDIKLIMMRADTENKGYLNFEDFFDLLIPFSQEYRENLGKRIPTKFYPNYKKGNLFLLSTKIYLANLIRTIIESENELNIIKENIVGINVHLENIYRKIDKKLLGFFNERELLIYLRNCGINCNEIENRLIFIRFDKNKDEKVEFWEIEEELMPL